MSEPVTHFIRGGGMLHAVPSIDDASSGSEDWSEVTCPTCLANKPADGPQLSISTIESTNFGDHGERIRRDHVVLPGETVEELALRVFPGMTSKYRQHDTTDVIEIRVLVGADGKCTGDGEVGPL